MTRAYSASSSFLWRSTLCSSRLVVARSAAVGLPDYLADRAAIRVDRPLSVSLCLSIHCLHAHLHTALTGSEQREAGRRDISLEAK
jgi:hypothetical protein